MSKPAYAKLYSTARWQRLRLKIIARDRGLCRMCKCTVDLKGRIKPTAAEIDHITPHKGDVDLFFDEANLQLLCKGCHSTVKQRQERGARRAREDGWSPR